MTFAQDHAYITELRERVEALETALRDLIADIDDVAAGKLPEISAAAIARARQVASQQE